MANQKNNSYDEEVLLSKYLSGTASDDEIRLLRQNAGLSETLKAELRESEKVIGQIDLLEFMKSVDTLSAHKKIKSRITRTQTRSAWMGYLQKAAAILFVPLLIASIFQFISKDQKVQEIPEANLPVAVNEIRTPSGIRSHFILPDGTEAWLNGNTKITYPVQFTGPERHIGMEGEAFFKVAKNPGQPFIVGIKNMEIKALGTEFNCMAYPGDPVIETSLAEGMVKITKTDAGRTGRDYILKPGQVLSYETSSGKFSINEGNIDKNISWRSGKFIFRNDPLGLVCRKLGRWFNAEIVIEDENLKNYTFTGTFQDEGLKEIMELISLTTPLKYTIDNRKINEKNEYGTLKIIIKNK